MALATAAFGFGCCGLPRRVAARDEFTPPVRSSCAAQWCRANFLWPCRDSVSIHPCALDAARIAVRCDCLEPISKSPKEDNEASELYEAEEVVGVVFPTDEDAALPLNPSKEALHEPTSHIAA